MKRGPIERPIADGQISVLKRMNYRGNNISNINENTVGPRSSRGDVVSTHTIRFSRSSSSDRMAVESSVQADWRSLGVLGVATSW